jgi:hypothetical protein
MAYLNGNIAQFTVTFTTEATGAVIDPTTITFKYQTNGGAFTTPITYTSATTPSVGVIARISTGVYETWVDTTSLSGVLTGEWVSTGTGAAAVTDTVTIGATQGTGLTFGDLIETVFRRTIGPVQQRTITINQTGGIGSGDTTVTFAGPQSGTVLPGVVLSCELENLYVQSVSGQVATVIRGYEGSLPATHANGTLMYIDSTVTRFDIAQAINDDLRDLSANGLFRVGVAQLTYNAVFQGYDLSALPSNWMAILGVAYREISPARRFPVITEFDIRRWNSTTTDPAFPSGSAIILYEAGFPGLPLYVTYSAPFIPLVSVTDSVINTPAVNDQAPPIATGTNYVNGYPSSLVSNLALTMVDIPPLGATAALIQPQEIGRDNMGIQPNPRRAAEVPAQAISSSTNAMLIRRAARISAEADRLSVAYPDQRR